MKRIIITLILLALAAPLFAETIVLKSGQRIEAKIIEKADDYIKIDFYGVPITHYREDIEEIISDTINEGEALVPHEVLSKKMPQDIFTEVSPAVVYFSVKQFSGEKAKNIGSGFIVDSDGLIITNHHVISDRFDQDRVSVVLKDGSTFPIESVVYTDPEHDMTILKITASHLPVVKLGNSDKIGTGEVIYCIGASLGLEYSFSDGVLSGVRQDRNLNWLQFTAPVSPGNSGGPLITSKGEIVGLVSWQYRIGQNINFALAINHIKPVLEKYRKLAFGKIEESTKADYYRMQGEKILQGDYYPSKDQYREAIIYFKKALELQPDSFDLKMQLADAYRNVNDNSKAIELYGEIIRLSPERYEPYVKLGEIYRWQEPKRSVSYYEKSIDLKPDVDNRDDLQRYEQLASVYGDVGRYREARKLHLQLKRFYLRFEDYSNASFCDIALKSLFIKKWGYVLLFLFISSLITIGFAIRCLIKRKKIDSTLGIKGIMGIPIMIIGIIISYYGLIVSDPHTTLIWALIGFVAFAIGTIAVFIKNKR